MEFIYDFANLNFIYMLHIKIKYLFFYIFFTNINYCRCCCKYNSKNSNDSNFNNKNEENEKNNNEDKKNNDNDKTEILKKNIFKELNKNYDINDEFYEHIKQRLEKYSLLIIKYLNSINEFNNVNVENIKISKDLTCSSGNGCNKFLIFCDNFKKTVYIKKDKKQNVNIIDILKQLNLTDLRYYYDGDYLLTEELKMENYNEKIFKTEYIKDNGITDLENFIKKIKNFKVANIVFAILNLRDCNFLYRPDNLYLTKDNDNNLLLKILDIDVNIGEFKKFSILCDKYEFEKGNKNKCFYHTLSAQTNLDFCCLTNFNTGGIIKILKLYNTNKLLSKLLFSCNFNNINNSWKCFISGLNMTEDEKKMYKICLKNYNDILKYIENKDDFNMKYIINNGVFLQKYIKNKLNKDINISCFSHDIDNIINCFNEIITKEFLDDINKFYNDFLTQLSTETKTHIDVLKNNIEYNEIYLKIFLEYYNVCCGFKEDLFEKIMDPENFTEDEKKDLKEKLDLLLTLGYKNNVDIFKNLNINPL